MPRIITQQWTSAHVEEINPSNDGQENVSRAKQLRNEPSLAADKPGKVAGRAVQGASY
jgi:hypothetical protein